MSDLPYYYKNIFKNLNGLIVTKNLYYTVTSANEDLLNILGIHKNEILNKNYNEMGFFQKELIKSLKYRMSLLLKIKLI